jgi:bacterial/archaeal transporter family-2 protein
VPRDCAFQRARNVNAKEPNVNILLLILLAVIGGVAIALQGQFMGLMDQRLGTRESVFITYTGGGLLACVLMLASRGLNLGAWQAVPWYAYSSGLLGLFIVGVIGYVVPRLGLAIGFTLIVASQFLVSALMDQFGLCGAAVRPLEPMKWVGLGVVLFGVYLMVR